MHHRFKFAGLHLLASALVACLAATLVFGVWYPAPLHALAGGLTLFTMLAAIDVVLGPAMTLVIANPSKPRAELRRDLAVIAALQLAGLAYGLYTIALARPVYVVFELDRFQIVSAADFEPADLAKAPQAFRQLPWNGPRFISARRSRTHEEMLTSIEDAFGGRDLARQPARWESLADAAPAVWKAAKPLDAKVLKTDRLSARAADLARQAGVAPEQLRYLPVMGRDGDAVALVADGGTRVVGYLPITVP